MNIKRTWDEMCRRRLFYHITRKITLLHCMCVTPEKTMIRDLQELGMAVHEIGVQIWLALAGKETREALKNAGQGD